MLLENNVKFKSVIMLCHVTHYIYLQKLGKLGEGQFVAARYYYTFNLLLKTYIKLFEKIGVIASKSSVVGDMKEDTNEKLCLPMEKPPPPPVFFFINVNINVITHKI